MSIFAQQDAHVMCEQQIAESYYLQWGGLPARLPAHRRQFLSAERGLPACAGKAGETPH
jgi:hypothetical protein